MLDESQLQSMRQNHAEAVEWIHPTHLSTWEHMEALRLKRLRMPTRYSREFSPSFILVHEIREHPDPQRPTPEHHWSMCKGVAPKSKVKPTNSLAPFFSMPPRHPTCGVFFSRENDNKKYDTGIPPVNVPKWSPHRK